MSFRNERPLVLTDAVHASSRILNFLDAKQISWQKTNHELIDAFGLTIDPYYEWQVVSASSNTALCEHMISPFSFVYRPTYLAHRRPTYLSSAVYVTSDSQKNLDFVVSQLTPVLGNPEDCSVSNTISFEWHEPGLARISATIWPMNKRGEYLGSNPAHNRHPFLRDACYIGIELLAIDEVNKIEAAWMESFVPLLKLPKHISSIAGTSNPMFQYVKRHSPLSVFHHTLGQSADKQALIYVLNDGYCELLPMKNIAGFIVECEPPERGGYDTYYLHLCMQDDFLGTIDKPYLPIRLGSQYQHSDTIDMLADVLSNQLQLTRLPAETLYS